MDVQYLLWSPKHIRTPYSQYLRVNDKDQTIEIRPDLPLDHPLQRFRNGNVLDVDKYFDKVRNNFLLPKYFTFDCEVSVMCV